MSNQDRYRDQDRERSPRDAKRSRYSDAAPSSSRKYRSPSPEELLSGRRERDRRDGKDREYSKRDERDRDRDADRSIRERERVKDGRMREDERYERDRGERTREKDRDRERDRDRDRDRERDRNRDYARSDRDRDSDRSHRYRDEPRDRDRDRERERERDSVRSKDSPRIDRNGSSTPTAPPPLTGSSTPVGSHTPQPIAPPSPLATFASPTGLTSTEEDKQRIKREKMEAWKKAQAAKKQAEEVRKVVEEKAKALSGGPKVALPSKPVIALSAGTAVGGLPVKPSFALPAATLARIGLPLKPAFVSSTTPIPAVSTSTTKKASTLLDDAEHSDRKLTKMVLPPIDPLFAPGAGTGAEHVGDDLDFMDDDEDDAEEAEKMDVDLPTIARKRLNAARGKVDFSSDGMDVDPTATNGNSTAEAAEEEEEEEDPLDAFMKENTKTVKKVNDEDLQRFGISAETTGRLQPLGAEEEGEDDDEDAEQSGNPGEMTAEQILALAAKKSRKKDLPPPDHSAIQYEPFRKAFYVPSPDTEDLDEDTVELMRLEMDGIKIRGKDCPKPVTHWGAFGLPAGCYDVIKRLDYERPTPIQAQAIPAIMSGRDLIGVAKTGSGKTIAFLLPMFRHIKDQRPLETGEGPMAIIMTPTRELATQIWRESKPFMAAMGMRAVCAYGGSPLSEQIADMKKGCEVVVCTPGRMIDLLTANSGRVTNVRRVTYMVLDEADRMFDMGFEPQVMKIINNVRPDRQTVLFSATFPQKMDALARKILQKPLEITVGGRSVVAKEIDQRVELLPQSSKWLRLLEILGEMGEEHKDESDDFRTLVFVERQESADELFQNLMQKGYICASLHGGKDQVDREQAISDFKAGYIPIVIATSIAARGLDVKELKLVINYDCPNHMEDYIHRAGRTGRAGNKGVCMTFITPEQERFSVDIVRALKSSEAFIPPDLAKLAEEFLAKVKAGKAKTAGSGFGGKGLDHIEEEREQKDRAQRSTYTEDGAREENPSTALVKVGDIRLKRTGDAGTGSNEPSSSSNNHHANPSGPGEADYTFSDFKVEIMEGPAPERVAAANAKTAARNANNTATSTSNNGVLGDISSLPPQTLAALQKADAAGKGTDVMGNLQAAVAKINAALNKSKTERAAQVDLTPMSMSGGAAAGGLKTDKEATEFHAIVPINDYPQRARWSVTAKERMVQLQDLSGASITNKGLFYPPGVQPKPEQEPKLYLLIESNTRSKVVAAVDELRRVLVETSIHVLQNQDRDPAPAGRYRV